MRINPLIRSDGYKISHPHMYPEGMNFMYDYVEARKGGLHPEVVFFGLQMYIDDVLMTPFTQADIDEAAAFYKNYFGDVVFKREIFEYILETYNGYFPVRIDAVPEGTVVPEGNVLISVQNNDPKVASIVSFLETLMLSYIWYGTTVATNSYKIKETMLEFGEITCDNMEWMAFALHDFGARGVIPGGQKLGGAAHLINFLGSDTLEGVFGVQRHYPGSSFPGYSVPATEHSVMGSNGPDGEFEVVDRVMKKFGKKGAIVSIVNDTYDMENHVSRVSHDYKDFILENDFRWVTRPDSGVPAESVLTCLHMLWARWGGEVNSKGYKVLDTHVRVLQGDGIDLEEARKIYEAVVEEGFSIENLVFGSGGGLLQKLNRDTQRFAMKCSYLQDEYVGRDIYKMPKTDTTKKSKKGMVKLFVKDGEYMTFNELDMASLNGWEPVMKTYYSNGTQYFRQTFDEVRANSNR